MAHPDGALVRRFYEARARGDWDEVEQALAPDVRWVEPGDASYSGEHVGRDQVLELLRSLHGELDVFELEPTDVVADDGYAVALVDWRASRGGRELRGREAGVFRVAEGRIVEARFYMDSPEDPEAFRAFWD